MSFKRNNKLENHRVKLSTIVERLPLYRFLDQSRAALLKLQPAWQAWQQQQATSLKADAAQMSGFEAGVLTISVNNASTAALIKHQKTSLIKALNNQQSGADSKTNSSKTKNSTSTTSGKVSSNKASSIKGNEINVTSIKVRIDLAYTTAAAEQKQLHAPKDDARQAYNAPDKTAINSIKSLQVSIKNPDLADSIGKLADTLKNLSKPSK